jgi:hypothetical protein
MPAVRFGEFHGDLYLPDRMRWPGHLGLLRLRFNDRANNPVPKNPALDASAGQVRR